MKLTKVDLHTGPKRKSIMVPVELHDKLDKCPLAKRGDTYAEIIEKLLDFFDEHYIKSH